jgi:hypothetical protein
MAGDCRRLQRRMMRIPAETQKRRFFIGLFLVLGITLRPFRRYFITIPGGKTGGSGGIVFLDARSRAVVYKGA